MREIKFKVWNEKEKWMVEPKPLRQIMKEVWECGESDCPFEDVDFDENIIVLQFTGLKDKNGKEIYEGDIVKFEEQIFKVEYWLAEFIIRQVSGKMKGIGDSITASKSKYEVIGNIYENPELLEAQSR